MFNRLYIQIAQCNNFLIQTEGKDDEESLTQRAEVRFIRALDYYYLIDFSINSFTFFSYTVIPLSANLAAPY